MRPEPLAAALLAVALALPATAQPAGQLVSGPGSTLTTQKCILCHDTAHITRSRLSHADWEDIVAVMLKRGMPPLAPEEHRVIIGYLVTYYGPNPPPPAGPDTLAGGQADPIRALLDNHACLGCHEVDKALVGPSFRQVAERHAGSAEGAARLFETIRKGGAGRWGQIPMPGNPALSDTQIRDIVQWVLGRR